jgi:16S rRNA (guanine527-N7)-methyltransferase
MQEGGAHLSLGQIFPGPCHKSGCSVSFGPMLQAEIAKDRQWALSLMPVSRETEERFDIFVQILARWREKINLISEAAFASVWTRHIADCAQIRLMVPTSTRWLDIGSGAGFPGIVLATQLAAVKGGVVHCVETDQRRCAFLREVARAACVPAVIHAIPIRSLNAAALGAVDGVTSRAVAPLTKTLDMAESWLRSGTPGIFPCGRAAAVRAHNICNHSRFRIESIPNLIDVSSSFLRVQLK